MEDCCHEEGIDEYDARNSNCGGSDDLSDDFDRQELEWALYSQIHHEEADDSKAHSKSWLEQECHISITEDEETSKNSREITSSTPNGAQSITDSSLLSSGKSSKKKKRKTLDEDSRKTSKESKKKLKENKKKSSNKDNIINLEALLVPGPSKITSVNKKHGKTEGAELSKHGKKPKHSDNSQKSKDVHKKGEIAQVFILVSSDNSDSNESEHQTPNAVTEKDDCASSDSNSEYSFGDIHAEEKMDIQLNINNPKEDCGSDTIFDSKDITIEDIHNSLGDCDWDLIDADVWKAGPVTGRMRSRYYRSSIKCNNCNERGHLMKDCPEPKKLPVCILCGLRGHTSRACPESLCYNCNHPGHGSRNCTEPRRSRTVECRRCFARGHIATECPDIWRQFHITTEPGLMCKGSQKENKSRSCFNCTRKSHWAYECRDPMMDSWKLPVTPFVAQYEMKAAFVTTKHTKKRASDSSHETPAKHIKPSHTPTKKTPQMTSEQRPEPTSYAKDIVAKNKSTAKSRVKRIAESLYSDDFPRTPLEEYVDGNEDTPRKRLTSKQENKRKWKAWQKKRKSEDRERKLSQLQQFTSYQDECEAPSHGRHWRGDSERRHGGGSRRSRQDSAACEGSNPGGGSKQSRRGGKGEGSDTRHSDRHEYGSHNDAWDPADYRDPWDTHADRHNSEGSRRDSGRKHVHVTRRGFRMFRQ